jgi:hypothetical protein
MIEDFLEGSWSYQEMVQRGFERGFERGIEMVAKQRELRALRSLVVSIVEARFPELTALAREQVEHFTTPELLKELVDKLLDLMAQTTVMARQVLMESDTPHPDA